MLGQIGRCDGCDQDKPIAWVEGFDLPDGTTEIIAAYCQTCTDERAEAQRQVMDEVPCNDCGQMLGGHDGTLCIEIQAEQLAKIKAEADMDDAADAAEAAVELRAEEGRPPHAPWR